MKKNPARPAKKQLPPIKTVDGLVDALREVKSIMAKYKPRKVKTKSAQ